MSLNRLEKLDKLNLKRKPDGSLYRSRLDMINDYKNSKLIYPLSAIVNIDYCRKILTAHLKNCFFFAFPLSLVLCYSFNPKVRYEGMQFKKHYKFYVFIYFGLYSSMFLLFCLDTFINCDYCKPWSEVYLLKSDNDDYLKFIKTRVKEESENLDIFKSKIRNKGLSDNDI